MKTFYLLLALLVASTAAEAQGFKDFLKKAGNDTAVKKILTKVPATKTGLSNDEIIGGLKEALSVGTSKGTTKLSAVDGFFRDAALKILLPVEAQKVEARVRQMGMGRLADSAILSLNRAAEDAAKSAAPIFLNAIKGITIGDGLAILRGGDFAATNFLKDRTTLQLTEAFRPAIERSLQKVNATKHWKTLFTTYNTFSKEKVNTDLAAYVTEKALTGIFYQVGLEEQKIRKDPVARTTDILRRVFAN